jgi:transposase
LEQRMEALRPAEQDWRFRSLLRRARLDEFVRASDPDIRLDHRARAYVGRQSKRGQEGQALGRSRGGFTTKIHAKSNASGDIAFDLTGGEASDARHFDVLLDIGPDIQPRAVICDKGYASKANREAARERSVAPVIPHKANERDKPAFFARTLYKARSRIEQGVGRLKRFKRVALRCERPLATSDQSSASPPAYAWSNSSTRPSKMFTSPPAVRGPVQRFIPIGSDDYHSRHSDSALATAVAVAIQKLIQRSIIMSTPGRPHKIGYRVSVNCSLGCKEIEGLSAAP